MEPASRGRCGSDGSQTAGVCGRAREDGTSWHVSWRPQGPRDAPGPPPALAQGGEVQRQTRSQGRRGRPPEDRQASLGDLRTRAWSSRPSRRWPGTNEGLETTHRQRHTCVRNRRARKGDRELEYGPRRQCAWKPQGGGISLLVRVPGGPPSPHLQRSLLS